MASPHQYIGFPQGLFVMAVFTSAAEVLAAGLSDGDIWVIVNPDGTLQAGAWPQTPNGGTCACGGPLLEFMGYPTDWEYGQEQSSIASPPLSFETSAPLGWLVIVNPT